MRIGKKRVAAAAVGALALAASTAAPAQAYSPNPKVTKAYYDTDKCTPGNHVCVDQDPAGFEWTVFKYDKNGIATKMELTHKGKFVGKVEFHPAGERVCAYDTRADSDGFYVTITWIDGNGKQWNSYKESDDQYPCTDQSMREGTLVDVAVYDNGYNKDLIDRTVGTA